MDRQADFTANIRLIGISSLAIAAGAICSLVAAVLLWLIALFTNLFYFQTFSFTFRSPAENQLGWLAILVPVVGGLIIGLMARYGSDRIRGHGIPEAIEAILFGRSRMSPKVAVLKPLSSAISIGSGGPFGAEGPIIMTGGACGSIMAQVFKMTSAERKTLLVAGSAAGMTATFGTPLAAVLLAVELLLFEWKPRSIIPVALACLTAHLCRPTFFEAGPLFPMPDHALLGGKAIMSAAVLGLMAGVLALLLTAAVYAMEDAFHRLPIHWMWWPCLGGLAVGIGGYFQPRALGVGYDVIRDLLDGRLLLALALPLLLVKGAIWSISLGSGTSGGVLAPLLMMGAALGVLCNGLLPGGDVGLWALVGVASILGGAMRCPLTGSIFALELTHDLNALPALLVGAVVSYAFSVLVMRRSILTEKVARRGYHVSREYSVDPLERITIGEIMVSPVVTVPAGLSVRELLCDYFLNTERKHQGYPVLDEKGELAGVLTRTDLLNEWIEAALEDPDSSPTHAGAPIIAFDLIARPPVTVFPWESCRTAAERMAHSGVGRLPVIAPDKPGRVIGLVTRSDLLKPRGKHVEEELRRERFIDLPGKRVAG
jgi:H+/Cl- antiporter ClcA/predicted transcriptional regulator